MDRTTVTHRTPTGPAVLRYAQPAQPLVGSPGPDQGEVGLSSNQVQRVFLGWDRPGLAAGAAWLARYAARPAPALGLDLSDVTVAVPGARAGRQVLNHLVAIAEKRAVPLLPPSVTTVGRLIERLYPPAGPVPNELRRCLEWAKALRQAAPETLRAILPVPPDPGDHQSWQRLAGMIDRIHADLLGHGLRFADAGAPCPTGGDPERWKALAQIQESFLHQLEREGLTDPLFSATVRLNSGATVEPGSIVLLAVSELPGLTAQAMARADGPVTALIVAPPERADWFDALGCVVPEKWCDARPQIASDRILFADGPEEQADAVLEALGSLADRFSTDEAAVGVPDAEVVPPLKARAARLGSLRFHDAAGTGLRRTGPYRLLEAIGDFAKTGLFRDWATLLRHPALEEWLTARVGHSPGRSEFWLPTLDLYASRHLPGRIDDGQWLGDGKGRESVLPSLYEATRGLLGPLWPSAVPPRMALREWADPILSLLRSVYATRPLRPADPSHQATIEACELLCHSLAEMAELPRPVSEPMSGAEALTTLLMQVEDLAIPPPPDTGAIELLGWLELPFDESPVLIVTGMNEGRVPRSGHADALLPDHFRTALRLPDSRSQAARDLYLLSVMTASRTEISFIAGRRTRRADPLAPSRLLFACDEIELVRRVRRFVLKPDEQPTRWAPESSGAACGFVTAPRAPFPPPKRIRVTSFKSFLRSPYGFFLEHLLGLKEHTDQVIDLDPMSFGSMVHEALRDFATGPAAASDREAEIRDALRSALDAYVARLFGPRAPAAVALQHAQARERLDEAAKAQATRRREGWRILHAEWSPDGGSPFVVDGQTVILSGSIDRIDRHEIDNRLFILDYKTSERADGPEEAHRKEKREWIDLQLPLYRHLAAPIIGEARVDLGYFVIPAQPGAVQIIGAPWTPDDLRAADDAARNVVRAILAGNVYKLGDAPPDKGILGRICGQNQIAEDDPDETEEEP